MSPTYRPASGPEGDAAAGSSSDLDCPDAMSLPTELMMPDMSTPQGLEVQALSCHLRRTTA